MTGDVPGDAGAAPVSIQVLRGSPTPDELAAVIAVVSAAYASEADTALAADDTPASAWSRSAHAMRRVPVPGSVWGRFEG